MERGRVPILCRRKKDGGKERCPFYADKEGSRGKGEEWEGRRERPLYMGEGRKCPWQKKDERKEGRKLPLHVCEGEKEGRAPLYAGEVETKEEKEGRKRPLYVGEGEKEGRKSPLYVGEGETKGEREARKDAHFTRAKAGSCGCRTELVFG